MKRDFTGQDEDPLPELKKYLSSKNIPEENFSLTEPNDDDIVEGMKEDNGDSAEQLVENGESGGENGTDDSSKHINHSTPTPPSEQSQPPPQD